MLSYADKMEGVDQHELVAALKQMALKLGRTPNRREFVDGVPGAYAFERVFGTWSALIRASGLVASPRKRKVENSIFHRDLSSVLSEYKQPEVVAQPDYTPTLVIGDTHFPFVSERVLEAIYKWAQRYKPARVIQVVDLSDMYSHSKFPRSQNIYMPNQEEDLGRAGAEKMWATLRGAVPAAECVQLKGNHDVRPVKRTLETTPALERAVAQYVNQLMTFDGVKLIVDERQEYIVEGIEFLHGYRSKLGDHRDYSLMNAVCGHIHVGGTSYRRIRGQTLWELNAGLVGDPESKALSYTAQRINNWTPGFGWIDEAGPRFVPV